jgi:hypothetical protein
MFKFDKRDALDNALREPMERLPTEAGEAMGLAYEESTRTRRTDAVTLGLRDEYEPILQDIEKRTGKRFVNPANFLGMTDSGTGDLYPSYLDAKVGTAPTPGGSYRAQLAMINEFIKRNQAEMPDLLPLDENAMLDKVIEKGRAAREEWALASEYSGKGATAAGFLGGTGAIVTDPPNIIATVAGMFFPPSRGMPFVLREAGLNASAELLAEPGKRKVAQTFGFQRDLSDMALDVGGAAAFGAGFAGTVEGVSRGFSYLRSLRNSKNPQERSAAIVHDRAREAVVGDNPSSYAEKTAAAESGGSLTAKASTSSATGKFQFITDTWNDLSNETGVPPVIEGQPDPRLNEAYQDVQEAAYRKRSVKALSDAGFVVDDTNLYLSHFLGQQGAVKFLQGLKASADAPASSFVDADAVAANKSVFFKKNGQPKTAQEFYQWASKKMGAPASGLPDQHLANYDSAIKALNEDAPVPEPAPIPGPMRAPHIEGLELVDPASVQVDAKTFQFKEGGDTQGVTDRLKGVKKWEQDFAGVALVYERADGTRFIADGHQRLGLAKQFPEAKLNARILREADGWTPESVRVRAAIKNIAEGTGSPLDAARIMRTARDADLPPLPPTSALVRQGRALAELADEPFMMVVNGVVPENYGAIVGRLMRDPKLQEAAIRVLNKTNPDNAVQAEAIVRQVADTEVTTSTQVDLFGEEQISESLFLERAKVMDASLKSLKKDKAVFATLVNQADRIEGAGNRLSRETNLERMTQDAKVSEYIQKLASRKGPISDALTDAARKLKEGGRPGDATRSFLQAVRGAVDDGVDGGSGGRGSGQVVDSQRPLEPAEIRAQQEFFEKEPDVLDELVSRQVDTALEEGRLSKDSAIYVEDATGNLVKRKVGDVLEEIDADQRLVNELTDCVQGAAEEAA